MVEKKREYPIFEGKTYSLFGDNSLTDRYYYTIRTIVKALLKVCPDERTLLIHIQKADGRKFRKNSGPVIDRSLVDQIKNTVSSALAEYTKGVQEHLRTLSMTQRFDSTLKTKEPQYHFYMLEIELINRIHREAFKQSKYKFALLPHCLRDFRPDCKSVPGDIEHVCRGCTEDCFIRLGSVLLGKYHIHPYISVTMNLEKLFRKLKAQHPSIGALGIACIPELAQGMRLCIKLGIPPVGIPLNANRCARWMKQAHESSFDLKELEELVNQGRD